VADWAKLTFVKPMITDHSPLPNADSEQDAKPLSIIALIDDESIRKLEKKYGSYPWQGKAYQSLLASLENWYHPSVIALTKPFTPKTRESLILNASSRLTQTLTPWQIEALADDVFESPLSIGELNTPATSGNPPLRSVTLLWEFPHSNLSEKRLPSLALNTVMKHFDEPETETMTSYFIEGGNISHTQNASIKIRPGKGKDKNTTLPAIKTNANFGFQPVWYPVLGKTFQGYTVTHTTIPLWRLLEKQNHTLLKTLKDVPLILGYNNALDADKVSTPFSNQHLLADVQATVVDNLIQGDGLINAPIWQQGMIVICGFLLLLIFKLLDKTTWQSGFIACALMSGYFAFYIGSLSGFHLVFNALYPIYGILAGFAVGEWCRQFQRERALVMMESNLAQLVSPTVLKEIVRRKEKLEAGGRRIIITSMFVDIRDFTKISEGLAPSEVTDMLNAWYTQVELIVTEYRGTVDKYLGDGALIMFGAPMETNQHADMAIRAARHLVAASHEFAESWNKKSTIPFSIGISLNSGAAFVGFVGPSQKLEFTAIGDTVNTSSRLQDHAKAFKTVLIFSESTLRTCTNMNMSVPVVPLGEISIRGKETHVNVFTFADMFLNTVKTPITQTDTSLPLISPLGRVNATGFVLETGFQQNSSRNAHLPLSNTLLPNTPLPEQQPPMVQSTAAKPMVLPPTMAPFPPPIIRTEAKPPVQTNEFLVLRPPSFGTTTKEASPFLKPLSPPNQGQEKSNPFTQKKPPFKF
jgi:class 3 adenylate cyclase